MSGRRASSKQPGILLLVLLLCGSLLGCPRPVECLRCPSFEQTGVLQDARIIECSGLVASAKNPGVLFMHNDSGDTARIFAVQENGLLRGVYELEDVTAVDWEDMARGPCPNMRNTECLYMGDIGDNGQTRDQIQVYCVEEPLVPPEGTPESAVLQNVDRFACVYPDGPHDAETLLVDPETAIPYVVTKAANQDTKVYKFPGPPVSGETAVLEWVATLASRAFLTGGDTAQDGSRVILRDYLAAYDYPRRAAGSFDAMFSQEPCLLPLALEAQGEALAISPSGVDVFTASEGLGAPIYKSSCEIP
jgi:hypothetical protein